MATLRGVSPVVPTLFDEGEAVAFDAMEQLICKLIDGGVHALTMFGIGSEYYKLSERERKQILDLLIRVVDGRVPTIVSITAHSTKQACEDAEWAQKAGASAIMILPPFFLKPDTDSILQHFDKVISCIDVPVVLQYAPNETQLSLPGDTFLRLSERCKRELYVKVECRPTGPLVSYLNKNGLNVLIGSGGITFYENLERGAQGVMPGCSLYDVFLLIYEAHTNGDREESFRLQNTILPYLTFVDQNTEMFLASEKYFLKLRGLIEETNCRAPRYELDSYQKSMLEHYHRILSPLLGE